MSDTEEVQKQEEPMETDEVAESTPAKEVDNEEEEKTVTPSSSKKSPTKSTAKSPKKEAVDSPSASAKSSPAKSPKKAAEAKESPAASVKSSPAKSPKKAKKEESEEEEEEEDEDEEEEKGEEKKGVLDMPLVIEGKRKRESTSFLKVEENLTHKHKAPVPAGSGLALEDIPYVLHQIESEKKVADLRPLYRMCYGTMGKMTMLRKEVKKFNGFSFAKDSAEYKKKHDNISKFVKADLSHVRRLLGLATVKSKEEEVQTILDFLLKPQDEGKSVPKKAAAAAKRKSSAAGPKTPAKRSRKESKSKETVDTESGEESEDEEKSESGEEKTPKKTPKKAKKAVEKKKKETKTPSKTPSKKTKKVESEDEDEKDDHSGTSSSDSSQKKDEKPQVSPSDKELKEKIGELLKTFDLTSVSMKQMVLAVCKEFPDHPEVVERTSVIKAFIKEAIKDVE